MQNDYLDLFAEEGEEAREGFGGGVVGKEGDETGADDGAGGVALGCLEGLAVGDAEAYHAGIAQIHGVNPIEIGLFYGVEFLLCAGGRSRRDHVDKAVGVAVDKPDAFLRGQSQAPYRPPGPSGPPIVPPPSRPLALCGSVRRPRQVRVAAKGAASLRWVSVKQ